MTKTVNFFLQCIAYTVRNSDLYYAISHGFWDIANNIYLFLTVDYFLGFCTLNIRLWFETYLAHLSQ